jgi:hypothetical protein
LAKYSSIVASPSVNILCCSTFSTIDPGAFFSQAGKKNFSS